VPWEEAALDKDPNRADNWNQTYEDKETGSTAVTQAANRGRDCEPCKRHEKCQHHDDGNFPGFLLQKNRGQHKVWQKVDDLCSPPVAATGTAGKGEMPAKAVAKYHEGAILFQFGATSYTRIP
jgi:hypothetical protein